MFLIEIEKGLLARSERSVADSLALIMGRKPCCSAQDPNAREEQHVIAAFQGFGIRSSGPHSEILVSICFTSRTTGIVTDCWNGDVSLAWHLQIRYSSDSLIQKR